MIAKLRSQAVSAIKSEFAHSAAWYTALSVFERAIAVVQTIVIARILGITEYGVYGLLFGTIGFIASVLGLQMGQIATVYISRYRTNEKAKAAAVMAFVSRFGWIVALLLVVGAAPFSQALSSLLLGSRQYQLPVMISVVFVGATIVSGVQDGVAQGFEIFRTLAKLKIVASLLTLLSIYPMAHQFGLDGVLAAVLCGLALKCVILRKAVARSKADAAFPKSGSGVSLREIMVGFAIPSMSVSLGVGFMTWLGTFMLSKQPSGFDQVAIVNAGLQWRGPVLLLALSVGTVAVPAFSRLASQRDDLSASRLRKRLTLANVTAALLVVAVLVPTAEHILNLYGPAFADGYLAFSIIVLSCVPAVVNSVFMHQLVGAGRMWRVFWLHCPHFVVWLVCIVTLVPTYRATGFALSLLIGGTVLTACTVLVELWSARRTPRDHMVLETRTQAKSP